MTELAERIRYKYATAMYLGPTVVRWRIVRRRWSLVVETEVKVSGHLGAGRVFSKRVSCIRNSIEEIQRVFKVQLIQKNLEIFDTSRSAK
jgi:hypothetical protein